MDNESSQLWRGVVTDTYTGRFVGEAIVRATNDHDANRQLSRWFDELDLGSGDWTLSASRIVTKGPTSLVATRREAPKLWPVEPPAAASQPRSVPPSLRYR